MAASVENFLSCSICFGRFDRPKSLPCQHTFCEKCLESQVRPRQPFRCPNCQRPVQLPPEGVVGLPDNDLVENLYQQITSSASLSVTAIRASKAEKTCFYHPLEDLKLFCQQCHVPVCTECLDETHTGHSAITIKRASEQKKATIRALVGDGRRAVEGYYTFLSELRSIEKILDKNKRVATQGVTDVFDDVVRKATLRKEILLSEVEENHRHNLESIEGHRTTVLNQVDEISTACNNVERASIYEEEDSFEDEKRLQSLIAKKDKVVMTPLRLETVEFEQAEDEKNLLNLGDLQLQPIPSGQRGKRKSSSSSVNNDKRSQRQPQMGVGMARRDSTKKNTEREPLRIRSRNSFSIKDIGKVRDVIIIEKSESKSQAPVEENSGKTEKYGKHAKPATGGKSVPDADVQREEHNVARREAGNSIRAGVEPNGKTEESSKNEDVDWEEHDDQRMGEETLKRKLSIARRIRIHNGFHQQEHHDSEAKEPAQVQNVKREEIHAVQNSKTAENQATHNVKKDNNAVQKVKKAVNHTGQSIEKEENHAVQNVKEENHALEEEKEENNPADKTHSSVSMTSSGSGEDGSKDGLVRKILGGYQESGTLGGRGSGFGKFVDPGGVAVSDKELFVADYGKDQILVFDLQGNYQRCFRTTLPGSDLNIMKPHDVALDRDGHLWVAGHEEDDIAVQYSVDGNFRHKINLPHATIARGIAVNMDKNYVLVTETNGTRGVVRVLRSDGSLLRTVGGQQDMKVPRYLAVDRDGNILVSDSAARGIFAYDEDGNFKFKFGGDGSGEGQLRGHRGIATDNSGNIIVADCENHRVEKFSSDGQFASHLATGVQEPWAVAVGPAGHIVLTDRHSHTVTIVQATRGRKESYI
ncbi:tripartite motif-containing protein 2-like [Branchiostoma lanceolatum]|uniref:tripartite motif-containing protein 2-like n=1 Tax=Branchiostoma lanceolatum TaxID=7740 RepID=UPI00345529CD